jgi:ribosomal protein S18 acetylase RimI-like enzyme
VDHRSPGHIPAQGLNASLRLPAILRRAATPGDEPFLFELYCAVRAHEFALLPELLKQHLVHTQYEAQQDGYRAQFPGSGYEVVFHDERKVGRIWIASLEDSLHLVDIAILPEAQNSGIGTALVRELQREAKLAGKAVRLSVFRFNPGSVRFHQRLGFTVTHEDEIQLYFEWDPKRDQ